MKRVSALLLVLILLLVGCEAPPQAAPIPDGTLQVHFIDVGQADCILIRQGENAMLIDAGNNEDGQIITDYLQNAGITELTYAVGTHPHEDHIGALDTVISAMDVENVLMPRIQTNTKTFEDVLDAVSAKGLTITAPSAGDTFPLGDAVVTSVSDYHGDDLNNASIMLRLTYGETAFLFTGDAEGEAEAAAMATGLDLRSDVLKVGHHGSSTSTSSQFLAAVDPACAVISCGKGNDYGHPHRETMTALAGREIFRTDEMGTVIAFSDGSDIAWNLESIRLAPATYVLNTASGKFHLPTCGGAETMSPKNKEVTTETRQRLLAQGYSPCGSCDP